MLYRRAPLSSSKLLVNWRTKCGGKTWRYRPVTHIYNIHVDIVYRLSSYTRPIIIVPTNPMSVWLWSSLGLYFNEGGYGNIWQLLLGLGGWSRWLRYGCQMLHGGSLNLWSSSTPWMWMGTVFNMSLALHFVQFLHCVCSSMIVFSMW